jgi:hypothetical protein
LQRAAFVGNALGAGVGRALGNGDGHTLGNRVGRREGRPVFFGWVGRAVGRAVAAPAATHPGLPPVGAPVPPQ